MPRNKKFMVVHNDPHIKWSKVEDNWRRLVGVENAKWIKTSFNRKAGVRFCEWSAPDEQTLKSIFSNMNISFESIFEIEETVPDLWGKKWEAHLVEDQKADTLAF